VAASAAAACTVDGEVLTIPAGAIIVSTMCLLWL
jgi:hypothetical protein